MSKHLRSLVVLAYREETVAEVVSRMASGTTKHFGISLIIDQNNKLLGVFNNGDVLRLIASDGELKVPIGDKMITDPVTVREGMTDSQIIEHVRSKIRARTGGRKEITQYVPILNADDIVVDVLDLYDLLARSPRQGDQVAVYGLGFVGLTLCAALSARGHWVTGIDTNEALVNFLKNGKPHVHEPRLPEMMRQGLNSGTLSFCTEQKDTHNRVIIISVGTPIDEQGQVSTDALSSSCYAAGSQLHRGDIVMLRSTVPVGTTRNFVLPILEKTSGLVGGKGFHLAFCPERTVEGKAIQELSSLPQAVGGLTNGCVEKAASFWNTLTDTIVRADSLEAAELVKLVNNSYRDLSFAFANGLALLADKYNLDASRLISAANEGYPRDPIPRPSPGVGGYCLTKDPFLFASVDADGGHSELARTGRKINDKAARYPVEIIERYAKRTNQEFNQMRVLIVGMAFKGRPETNDLRGSSSLTVARILKDRGCTVYCFDAVVSNDDLKKEGLLPVSLLDAASETDAILILNNHEDNVPEGLLECVGNGRSVLLFDGWNMLERYEVEKYPGITYASLGYMTPYAVVE